MLGIIQEQHPDRARLFMQWQQMNWPILVDALNLLGISAVPMTFLIDEFGVIQKINPRRSNAGHEIQEFLALKGENPPNNLSESANGHLANSEHTAIEHADQLILWDNPQGIDAAISTYKKALSASPDSGPLHFRLGVAYRMRYDFLSHQFGDFRAAVENWVKALEIDPNQYIWRRRIQQYGPRLDKPYPFYDWVPRARREITERGERPVDLLVEPGGAEYARPLRQFQNAKIAQTEPDPDGRIIRDQGDFISIRSVAVPSTNQNSFVSRIHLQFTPNEEAKAHWNNEVDDLELWINPPDGWVVNSKKTTAPNPKSAISQETREIEFELKSQERPGGNSVIIPAYALYYVCEDVNGACLYRRQDIPIEIDFK